MNETICNNCGAKQSPTSHKEESALESATPDLLAALIAAKSHLEYRLDSNYKPIIGCELKLLNQINDALSKAGIKFI